MNIKQTFVCFIEKYEKLTNSITSQTLVGGVYDLANVRAQATIIDMHFRASPSRTINPLGFVVLLHKLQMLGLS